MMATLDYGRHSGRQGKVMHIIGWILSGLVGAMLLAGAVYGMTHQDMVKTEMNGKHGYPMNSIMPIMIVELACIILYLIPQTAGLGAVLLTGYLGGAVATHVRAGEPWFIPVIVGIVIWLGLFFRDWRVRDLMPLRKTP
jgi:hypothetical protein